MEGTHVTDLWGVAGRTGKRLAALNIHTARELRDADAKWIRKKFSVVMERTVHELRGIPCIPLEQPREYKDQLIFSRSFSRPVETQHEMRQVLSIYAQKVSSRLRAAGQVAGIVSAWASTSWYADTDRHSPHVAIGLDTETDNPLQIASAALSLTPRIRHGFRYARAGVVLTGLRPKTSATPLSLFESEFEGRRVGETLDTITNKLGPQAIGVGLGGMKNAPVWNMKRNMLSRRATTHWDELCEAIA